MQITLIAQETQRVVFRVKIWRIFAGFSLIGILFASRYNQLLLNYITNISQLTILLSILTVSFVSFHNCTGDETSVISRLWITAGVGGGVVTTGSPALVCSESAPLKGYVSDRAWVTHGVTCSVWRPKGAITDSAIFRILLFIYILYIN